MLFSELYKILVKTVAFVGFKGAIAPPPLTRPWEEHSTAFQKTSIPQDQVIKKSCDTVQQKWKQEGWNPKFAINTSKAKLLSPHMRSFFNSLYPITKPPNKLKTTPNAVDLTMDLLLFNQARKHRWETAYHQFKITNLRQHHSHQWKS